MEREIDQMMNFSCRYLELVVHNYLMLILQKLIKESNVTISVDSYGFIYNDSIYDKILVKLGLLTTCQTRMEFISDEMN
ncbi:Hypothetical protein POVR1_LOCUS430 [uncultured virus]|nr:Hypothetical protein POVR1_LOCUS430 [uncultured virus]